MNAHVLYVEDDDDSRDALALALARAGFDVTVKTSAEDAVDVLPDIEIDVVLTDLRMRGATGLDLCRRAAASRPEIPVVVVTGFGSMNAAIHAMRAGAYDFVAKPIDVAELARTLERAVAHKRLHELKRVRTEAREPEHGEMLGGSAAMDRVRALVARVAETEATILVTGESGTGKELVARAIHARSRHADGPFVAINCAAMPEALLESELFGHAKGAFTDARQARVGLFVRASGGTLFLDEIGEMPASMQAKLLRALQERAVRAVGGDTETPFCTRLICATNRDLEVEVAQRRFREDLFYRINVVHIGVPPLRTRGNDVLALAQAFITRFALPHRANLKGLTPAAAACLVAYHWPGNVRELQNCIERAAALARHDLLALEDLPDRLREVRAPEGSAEGDEGTDFVSMDEVERNYVLRVLKAVGGNKSLAAEVLGFDRRTLYKKLEKYRACEARHLAGSG